MASHTEGLHLPLWAFVGFVLAVCFVSGIAGDVPDGVVYTDLQRTVQLGDRAVMKCLFYGTPLAVYWKNINDPSMIPKVIRRVEEVHDSGSCVQDKTCEMNSDYSLIIKNVTIADQGRYSCRVANYKGIMIYNYTDLNVYATPEEPYPFINECRANRNNCTVSAQSPLNITCTVSRYFPDVDIWFLHGAQKVSTIETVEWTKDDGTKSKLIFTRASPSKTPYVCMAFNAPGSQDESTATILVSDHHGNTTFGSSEPTESDPTLFNKIALPVGVSAVVVCSLTVLVKILCNKYGRRDNGTRDECTPFLATQRGKISYYELWSLAGKMTESQADTSKLRDTFEYLKITADIREGQLTRQEAYQALCEWKQENREGDQAKDLKEALITFHFGGVGKTMLDEKRNINRKVSQETMEHILWNIGDIEKVNQFLSQLIPDRAPINANEKMVCVVEEALWALNAWSHEGLGLNPFVEMSLALENAGCTYIDRLLFFVPDELMAPIQPEKLRVFTDKLTGRHCKRLAMALKPSEQKIDDYISTNRHYVFDTRSLITEWLGKVECSNYEKRCKLDDAVIKIGRYDLQDFFKTLVGRPNAEQPLVKSHYFDHESIFDDDIPQLVQLVKWLPPDRKTQLKMKIGLPDVKDDDDDTLNDQMKAWRDSITSTSSDNDLSIYQALKEFQSLRKELTDNPKYNESNVSKSTTKQLDREELHRIALNLMMEDVRPFIDVLGIDQEKVQSYVRQWNNQDNYTTGLLVNLKKESRNRDNFCKALRNVGFIDIARSVYSGDNVL